MKKEKTLTCPNCKKEQEQIGNWAAGNTYYKYDLATEDYEKYDWTSNDDGGYFCLECDHDIEYEELEKQGFEI